METVADVVEASSPPTPFPKIWWGKLLYGLFVTLMPALLFISVDLFKPEWQTGRLSDYVILALFPKASLLFFPLLAYSIICYLLLLVETNRYSSFFIVRLGIYTGVFLALQYCVAVILSSIHTFGFVLAIVWLVSWIFPYILRGIVGKWGVRTLKTVLATIAIAAYLISSAITKDLRTPLFLLFMAMTMAAPFWCFLLAFRASIWLFKNHESKFTLLRGAGLATWFAGYAIALRFDILKMYELYAALPPQPPPDCYIATAAAQGHPKFVGSKLVVRVDGSHLRVNRQLQILKCGELTLMAIHPRFHKILRRIYDVIGKSLARRIQDPFLADVAYILLKPLEWLARFLLKRITSDIDSISDQMYVR